MSRAKGATLESARQLTNSSRGRIATSPSFVAMLKGAIAQCFVAAFVLLTINREVEEYHAIEGGSQTFDCLAAYINEQAGPN